MPSEDDVALFRAGRSDEVAPFLEPVEAVRTPPGQLPYYEADSNGRRLRVFAEHLGVELSSRIIPPYDWVNDTRRDEQQRLLIDLAEGDERDLAVVPFDLLWQTLYAVVRAERFNDGLVAVNARALTRAANELRRRIMAEPSLIGGGTYRLCASEKERTRILTLLREGAPGEAAFMRLRGVLSGRANNLMGLRALVAAEPSLEERLTTRIVPTVLRCAERLLTGRADSLNLQAAKLAETVSVSKDSAAGWVAHMLLGTLSRPPRDSCAVDFAPLLSSEAPQEQAKLRCILAYFDRLADGPLSGSIDIERIVLDLEASTSAEWAGDASPLTAFDIDLRGSIEGALGHRQVDFANRYIGGGVLSGGCVQEEIRFATCPELLVSMIVAPAMLESEAVVIRGTERFSRTSGYGRSLRYAGAYQDPAARALDGTPDTELVAIDAMDYRGRDPREQLKEGAMLRELTKARAGFYHDDRGLPIATGNWGCGAFGGHPVLKSLLQWLAASSEGRSVTYFPFGDRRLEILEPFVESQRRSGATVGSLWHHLAGIVTGGIRPDADWEPIAATLRNT